MLEPLFRLNPHPFRPAYVPTKRGIFLTAAQSVASQAPSVVAAEAATEVGTQTAVTTNDPLTRAIKETPAVFVMPPPPLFCEPPRSRRRNAFTGSRLPRFSRGRTPPAQRLLRPKERCPTSPAALVRRCPRSLPPPVWLPRIQLNSKRHQLRKRPQSSVPRRPQTSW